MIFRDLVPGLAQGRFVLNPLQRFEWIALARRCSTQIAQRAHALEQHSGVRVTDVAKGSPAQRAGVESGDLIVGLDGQAVTGIDALQRLLDASRIGRLCVLRLVRRAQLLHYTVTPLELR